MELNLIDACLILLVVLAGVGGWYAGFVVATMELVALACSVVVALLGYSIPASWIEGFWPRLGVWIAPIAFFITFVVAHVVIGLVTGAVVRLFPRRAHAHGINRFLGIAPGLANGLLAASVVSMVLLTVPVFERVSAMAHASALAAPLAGPAQALESALSPIFEPAVRRTMRAITVPPDSGKSIPLGFKVTEAKPRPDLEAKMLELVNQERAKEGLKALKADPELVPVARGHGSDMLARGYFAHASPEGGDLGDRMRKADLRFQTAGENLAYAQTLPMAHRGLMNSPGHRANILKPQFARVGIGVLDAGSRGLMVTQNFRN